MLMGQPTVFSPKNSIINTATKRYSSPRFCEDAEPPFYIGDKVYHAQVYYFVTLLINGLL